jgi:hypothetical protein
VSALFPHANIVAGILLLVVGFGGHFLGQAVSLLNWDLARRWGLQERGLLPQYQVYERAIAVADTAIGWVYGIAALGLLLGRDWGYTLAWMPGSILLYHAVSAWAWEANRRAAGHGSWSEPFRIGWCGANALTGVLALLVAWFGVR